MPDTDWLSVSGETPCTDFDRAMRRFSSVSGIPFDDLLALRPDDAADLLRSWSAANRLARIERALTAELAPAPPRFDRWSAALITFKLCFVAAFLLIVLWKVLT